MSFLNVALEEAAAHLVVFLANARRYGRVGVDVESLRRVRFSTTKANV